MAEKKHRYRFFVKDRKDNRINIDTLSEKDQEEIGIWAYQNLLKGLGYEPVKKEE